MNELFEKNWLSAILLRDNLHLLILSRWVIIYGSETSPCESSPKSRWMNYLIKNWVSAIVLEIISIYSFWVGEQLATGLKLHWVKALWDSCPAEIPWRSKISLKIVLSSTVFEILAFFVFCNFLRKIRKIQNGRHFLRDKIFFENWHGYFAEIPCSSKNFIEIALSSRVFEI